VIGPNHQNAANGSGSGVWIAHGAADSAESSSPEQDGVRSGRLLLDPPCMNAR
jgi:hypothetical protein